MRWSALLARRPERKSHHVYVGSPYRVHVCLSVVLGVMECKLVENNRFIVVTCEQLILRLAPAGLCLVCVLVRQAQ